MRSTDTNQSRTRDKERTRHQILAAAEQIITDRGMGFSIAEVAGTAGVTKSGLLHHFPSRNDLVAAVVENSIDRTWDEILAHVDPEDSRPGAFSRGYIKAMTGDSEYVTAAYSASGLIARIGTEVGLDHLAHVAADDPARLMAAFTADGLPIGRALAIRCAAEGVAMSLNTPYLTDEQRVAVRAELFMLSEPH